MIATQLLRDLVEIDSTNPRLGGSGPGESAVARYVARWAARHEWVAKMHEVRPGRHNVVVEMPGDEPGTILLVAHSDTVEATGSDRASAVGERQGRLHARGACDAKGALAAFMSGIEAATLSNHRSVILAVCIDEEAHSWGAAHLAEQLAGRRDLMGAVVGEPTQLRCVNEHMGVMRCTVTAHGPGGHSSQPADVPNPLVDVAGALALLTTASPPDHAANVHPTLGAASCTPTMFTSGDGPNLIPTRAEATLDRRTLPHEDPYVVWEALQQRLSTMPHVRLDPPFVAERGLNTPTTASICRTLCDALQDEGLDSQSVATRFGTDASLLAPAGIESVVFGPGSIEQAHTPDEWVTLQDVETASRVITRMLINPGPYSRRDS